MTADTEAPTVCARCGQRLFLIVAGRDVCERCRLGRTEQSAPIEVAETGAGDAAEAATRRPCRACDRDVDDAGHVLGLADGYCLSCRLLGADHPG